MSRDEQIFFMDNLVGIFIRCFFLIFALNILWFAFFLIGGGRRGYELLSQWFDLCRQDYEIIFYYAMALTKIFAFVFFLFSYIAIKLVLRKIKQNS